MRVLGLTLAQSLLLSGLLLSGCSGSHVRDHDAGRTSDAGSIGDGGLGFDAGRDAGRIIGPSDAGTPSLCDPQDARSMICPEVLCDGPGTWHWNGDRCFWIDCGACEGSGCTNAYSSESECIAAHASCEAALCTATEGTWLWWAEECEHYDCGFRRPVTCFIGGPVCDCGLHRSFVPGVGCADDPDCPIFEPPIPEELCGETGGSWGPICCNTLCGESCGLDCAAMACDCGPWREFDSARGCMHTTRCHERLSGESCDPVQSRCQTGTICCEHCGGAGCFGASCEAPQCDDDPDFDVCGNCLLCP
jgi:hypothetical protein